MLYPITFSIPSKKIVKKIPNKTKVLSSLIPGDELTYIYKTEKSYYKEYQKSMFAVTKKKAGWDCMRHYEILANGCIPVFVGLEDCHRKVLELFPKDLVIEGTKMFYKLEGKEIEDITEGEMEDYLVLANKLLEYTKEKLTTKSLAQYVIDIVDGRNLEKILLINPPPDSRKKGSDYLRDLITHGFKEIYKNDCHSFPNIDFIYKDWEGETNYLNGKGMTYVRNIDPKLRNEYQEGEIEYNIKNKYYDLIIYTNWHRGLSYYDLANKIYDPSKIVMMQGEDEIYWDNYFIYADKHPTFIREVYPGDINKEGIFIDWTHEYEKYWATP
tara:strand:+ start:443 stop:1423 length:981 start_codon:yes stop_codon:yes gene_type:complete